MAVFEVGAYSRLGAYEKAPKNVKLGSLRPSCATMAKKCTKEMHMQSCCFANLNLLLSFCCYSLPSRLSLLKLP